MTTDPEYAAAEMEEIKQAFYEADLSPPDKRLNQDEFIDNFFPALMAMQADKGQFVDEREEFAEDQYRSFNAINPDEDSISFKEYNTGTGIMMSKYFELQQTSEL